MLCGHSAFCLSFSSCLSVCSCPSTRPNCRRRPRSPCCQITLPPIPYFTRALSRSYRPIWFCRPDAACFVWFDCWRSYRCDWAALRGETLRGRCWFCWCLSWGRRGVNSFPLFVFWPWIGSLRSWVRCSCRTLWAGCPKWSNVYCFFGVLDVEGF